MAEEIIIRIRGEDALSAPAGKAEAGLDGVDKKVKQTETGMTKLGAAMATAAGIMLDRLVTAGLQKLNEALDFAIERGQAFESAWAEVESVLDPASVNIEGLKLQLLDLPPVLGSSAELTKALYQALSAGVQPALAVEAVGTAAKAAKVGLTDTFTAIDAGTSVINAFGLDVSDMSGIFDEMFTTVKQGKTTFPELSSVIGNLAPIAKAAGLSTDEMFASISALTSAGINTSQSVTGLKASIVAMLKPSEDMTAAIKASGFSSGEAMIKQLGWQEALEKLKDTVHGDTQKLTEMFGSVEALPVVFNLAGTSADKFRGDLEKIEGGTGAIDAAFKGMAGTTKMTWEEAVNSADRAVVHFWEAVKPAVAGFLGDLAGYYEEHKKGITIFVYTLANMLKEIWDNMSILKAWLGSIMDDLVDWLMKVLNVMAALPGETGRQASAAFDTLARIQRDGLGKMEKEQDTFIGRSLKLAEQQYAQEQKLLEEANAQTAAAKEEANVQQLVQQQEASKEELRIQQEADAAALEQQRSSNEESIKQAEEVAKAIDDIIDVSSLSTQDVLGMTTEQLGGILKKLEDDVQAAYYTMDEALIQSSLRVEEGFVDLLRSAGYTTTQLELIFREAGFKSQWELDMKEMKEAEQEWEKWAKEAFKAVNMTVVDMVAMSHEQLGELFENASGEEAERLAELALMAGHSQQELHSIFANASWSQVWVQKMDDMVEKTKDTIEQIEGAFAGMDMGWTGTGYQESMGFESEEDLRAWLVEQWQNAQRNAGFGGYSGFSPEYLFRMYTGQTKEYWESIVGEFRRGGPVWGNMLARLGEEGPEAVIPSYPRSYQGLSTMPSGEVVGSGTGRGGAGESGGITVNGPLELHIHSDDLAKLPPRRLRGLFEKIIRTGVSDRARAALG